MVAEDTSSNIFKELDMWENDVNTDPLELWLSTPTINSIKDPLLYWSNQILGASIMTQAFARMSLDFLSTPGESLHYYKD